MHLGPKDGIENVGEERVGLVKNNENWSRSQGWECDGSNVPLPNPVHGRHAYKNYLEVTH